MAVGLANLACQTAAQSQTSTAASPLRSFDWHNSYVFAPVRPWSSADGVTWKETYSDMHAEVWKVVGTASVGSCRGVVLADAGLPGAQAFIPNPDCVPMAVMARARDGNWRESGFMRSITTVYGRWSDEPSITPANVHGCTGWAIGAAESKVEVSIRRGDAVRAWADWTPPRYGKGPVTLRLTYGVRDGRLAGLKRVLVEGEPGPLYTGDRASVTLKTNPSYHARRPAGDPAGPERAATWVLRLRLDRGGAFRGDDRAAGPLLTALLASDRPRSLVGALTFRHRLQLVSDAGDLDLVASSQVLGPFSRSDYRLDNPQVRDLFGIAYARATHGLKAGCDPAAFLCRCDG
jgi:hypothetical protein